MTQKRMRRFLQEELQEYYFSFRDYMCFYYNYSTVAGSVIKALKIMMTH